MQGIIVLMCSQFIIKIVGLIYKLYLTNRTGFGDKGNAIYNSAFQIYALFLTISSIGVPNSISKLVSAKVAIGDNRGAYRIFKIAIAIFGLLGFIGSSILFLGASHIANAYLQIPEAKFTILALSPSVFLVSIASVLRGYFNGRENLVVTANSQSLEQIFKMIFTILIVENIAHISFNNTSLMSSAATLAITIATLFSLAYLYQCFIKGKKEIWQEVISSKTHKKESVKKIIKNILIIAIPITLTALFSAITKTIDALTVVRLLKKTVGAEQAKLLYGILSGKVDTLILLPCSFNIAFATVLVPAISSAIAKKEINKAKKKIELSILLTILIGLPCTLLMSIFSNEILNLLFPNASAGAEMLSIASLNILFIVLTQTISGALQGLGKVNVPLLAFAVGSITKLILNIILIPTLGIIGVLISSIISDTIIFIICFNSLNKIIKIDFKFNRFLFKPILANIIMITISYLLYFSLSNYINEKILLISCLIISCVFYVILILGLGVLSKEEIFMIPYGQKLYRTIKK